MKHLNVLEPILTFKKNAANYTDAERMEIISKLRDDLEYTRSVNAEKLSKSAD